MAPRALGALRGQRVAMIFQEPATAFDPVFTIGHQIAETIRRHTGKSETDSWNSNLPCSIEGLYLLILRSFFAMC